MASLISIQLLNCSLLDVTGARSVRSSENKNAQQIVFVSRPF
jgi:hypothetical protein